MPLLFNQILLLESQFEITFHQDYKNQLVSPETPDDDESFCCQYQELIQSNKHLHSHPEEYEFPWESTYWWVGGDGAGGLYFIDTSDKSPIVYYYDHEAPMESLSDKQQLSPQPLQDFIIALVNAENEFKLSLELRRNAIANRKWWQFWIPKALPEWLKKT